MKYNRHKLILELVAQRNIETQEELIDKLKLAGFEVTQATVSRDIRELKLLKQMSDMGTY
ncbi:MAG: arginine repressor, partial [Lachnospiraceae bacterium]|nr:arginine repressor [Lachnospiraceae bacterium]